MGWHFQPVLETLGAPRPFQQVRQALGDAPGGVPFYSGVVPYEALSWWHDPSWIASATLVASGAVAGTAVGSLLARAQGRGARDRSAPRPVLTLVGALVLGLLVGGGSALAWPWDPQASAGLWNGFWFWPVDVLYPITGAICAAAAAGLGRRQSRSHRA